MKVSGALNKAFSVLSALALVIMVALVFYNAVLRYVFNSSMPASEELSRFCFIWLTYLGIVVAYLSGGHVAVTVFTDLLKGKVKVAVNILKYIVMLAISGIVLYGAFQYTLSCNYKTVATGTNFMLVSSALLFSFLALVCLILKDFVVELTEMKRNQNSVSLEGGGK